MFESNKNVQAIKGGSGFLLINILSKGLGFLYVILATRLLGVAEFGLFSLGISVVGLLENVGTLGLPNTIQRYLSGKGEYDADYLYTAIIIITFFTSFIVSLFLYFSSEYISINIFNDSDLTNILKLFSFGLFFKITFNIYKSLLQSQLKIRQILVGTTLFSISKILILSILYYWINTAISATLSLILASLFGAGIFAVFLSKASINFHFPNKKHFIKVLRYSLPLILVGFTYIATQQSDRLMLGWLSTTEDVGIYTAISTLAIIMTVFHSSFVSVFLPTASESYRDNKMNITEDIYSLISKLVGTFNGVLILLISGFGFLILNLLGGKFSTILSYKVLLLLSFRYYFGAWLGPTGAFLLMTDGHKIELYNTIIVLISNIVLNFFLISKFGLIGAAYATLISGVLLKLIQVIEIKIIYKFPIIQRDNIYNIIIILMGIPCIYYLDKLRFVTVPFFVFICILNFIINTTKNEKKSIINILKINV